MASLTVDAHDHLFSRYVFGRELNQEAWIGPRPVHCVKHIGLEASSGRRTVREEAELLTVLTLLRTHCREAGSSPPAPPPARDGLSCCAILTLSSFLSVPRPWTV